MPLLMGYRDLSWCRCRLVHREIPEASGWLGCIYLPTPR